MKRVFGIGLYAALGLVVVGALLLSLKGNGAYLKYSFVLVLGYTLAAIFVHAIREHAVTASLKRILLAATLTSGSVLLLSAFVVVSIPLSKNRGVGIGKYSVFHV